MTRPVCPHCGRSTTVVGTRVDGKKRVRYLGCRLCGYRVHGVQMAKASDDGRSNSKYRANRYGRFASN